MKYSQITRSAYTHYQLRSASWALPISAMLSKTRVKVVRLM
jgi:hypothetical protein